MRYLETYGIGKPFRIRVSLDGVNMLNHPTNPIHDFDSSSLRWIKLHTRSPQLKRYWPRFCPQGFKQRVEAFEIEPFVCTGKEIRVYGSERTVCTAATAAS